MICKNLITLTTLILNFSGACLASDLGMISPNTKTTIVVTAVLTLGPLLEPKICVNKTVAIVANKILTILLPIKTVLINLS